MAMPRLPFLVIEIEIPATPSIPVLEDLAVGVVGDWALVEHLRHRGVSRPLQGAKLRRLLTERLQQLRWVKGFRQRLRYAYGNSRTPKLKCCKGF